MLSDLETLEHRLKDPQSERESQQPAYARNPHRSTDPEYLVVMGICMHLGWSPPIYLNMNWKSLEIGGKVAAFVFAINPSMTWPDGSSKADRQHR